MTNKVNARDRKIGVMVMLSAKEIEFLDRKIDKKAETKKSRSALIQLLIHRSMLRPQLFDDDYKEK